MLSSVACFIRPLPTHAAERALQPVCDVCQKKITGKYSLFSLGDKKVPICQSCIKKNIRCQRCKIPVAKGVRLCATCQKTAPTCSLCKKKIAGNYTKTSTGAIYCRTCWALPKCSACRLPLDKNDLVVQGGEQFHPRCAKDMKVCGTCQKAIHGTYFVHSFIDEYFCATCEKTLQKCRVCSRPILAKNVVQVGAQKRLTCPTCAKEAVATQEEMNAIFAECQKIIRAELGESTFHEIPVTIVDDIGKIRKAKGFGSDGKELGLFYRKGEKYRIYILYGVTRRMAYETLSHEWTHAWFAENGSRLHTQRTEEGFCQWVAAKVLAKKNLPRTLRILKERKDDTYGGGYRYIHSIEQKYNTKGVLKFAQDRPGNGVPMRHR